MNRTLALVNCCVFLLTFSISASADPIISWIDPPEEIYIPAPKEGNSFLKVKVTDKEPESVFLALADSSDGERVYLDQTGEKEYTLNLSDPSVVAFARNADLSKGLRAYAQFHNRKIISSVVIRVKLGELFKKITLKCDPIRIAQRDVINLPGSHGQLQLHISDISNGMTVVSVVSEDGDSYLDGTVMRAGESDTFEIREGEEYTIICETFHNSLMGTDYGTFRVCNSGDWETYQIDRFIRYIEESDASFVAGKEKKTGPEFAKLLRAKTKDGKADKLKFAKFMNDASTSLDAKTACEVHTKDGKKENLVNWHEEMCRAASKKSNKSTSKPSN